MDIQTRVGRSSIINFLNKYYDERKNGRYNYSREAAICKCFCGDMCVQVALDAIQMLGGFGYNKPDIQLKNSFVILRSLRIARRHQQCEDRHLRPDYEETLSS